MPESILNYWNQCAARGDKKRPVYMIVSNGSSQPKGYVVGWAIKLSHARKYHQQACERNNGQFSIVKVS